MRSAESLRSDGVLERAHADGAAVFGFAPVTSCSASSSPTPPAPRIPASVCSTSPPARARHAGPWGSSWPHSVPTRPSFPAARPCRALTGFENHGGVTTVGAEATALADVVTGIGNGSGDGTEGAWSERVLGTYLHGPVLARNPRLADLLLGWAMGGKDASGSALDPLDDR